MQNRIHSSITDLIGHTPVVRLNAMTADNDVEIMVKLESHNPLGSVKDRIGFAIIQEAERMGKLGPGGTIIEATSGNTGIALAYAGTVKGYRVMLTMPESMSIERQRLLAALGAQLMLTPSHLGMQESVDQSLKLHETTPDSFLARQFENPANPAAHYHTTAQEILDVVADKPIDILVSTVGTGGTISGVGRRLREKNKGLKIVAVEPASSPLLSKGFAGPHRIQGIGPNFVSSNFDSSLPDEIICVSDEDAADTTRQLALREGIFCGISAGANVWAALQVASRPECKGKRLLTFICDTGERYVSTWIFAR